MKLNDNVYNILKWVVMIFAPALITLVSGLGVALGFDTTVATAVIGLVAAFIGSLIGVSTVNYNKAKA